MTDLAKFCQTMIELIENKAFVPFWFRSDVGLCWNALCFDVGNNTNVHDELLSIFEGKTYPFNKNCSEEYYTEHVEGTIYLNLARLEFLHKHAVNCQK